MLFDVGLLLVLCLLLIGGAASWKLAKKLPKDSGFLFGAMNCAAIFFVCAGLVFSPFVVTPLVNRLFLSNYVGYIEDLPPPPGVSVDRVAGTYGNWWSGNQCVFVVYCRLRSKLPVADVVNHYRKLITHLPEKYADTDVGEWIPMQNEPLPQEATAWEKDEVVITFMLSKGSGLDVGCN